MDVDGGAASGARHGGRHGARIGPNAITRVADALGEQLGAARRAELFGCAGLDRYLLAPPAHMVDESEVTRLHQVLHQQLPPLQARGIGRDAGARTGAYLLQNRIPQPVQAVLRVLPPAAASRLLVRAIRRHAWTFSGSAALRVRAERPVRFTVSDCPLCRATRAAAPCCDYYAACFEQLFRALVHANARVTETACAAAGDDACRFEVHW